MIHTVYILNFLDALYVDLVKKSEGEIENHLPNRLQQLKLLHKFVIALRNEVAPTIISGVQGRWFSKEV